MTILCGLKQISFKLFKEITKTLREKNIFLIWKIESNCTFKFTRHTVHKTAKANPFKHCILYSHWKEEHCLYYIHVPSWGCRDREHTWEYLDGLTVGCPHVENTHHFVITACGQHFSEQQKQWFHNWCKYHKQGRTDIPLLHSQRITHVSMNKQTKCVSHILLHA